MVKKNKKLKVFKSLNNKKVIEILKAGGVGVIPTDTLYGIIGLAKNKETVERIYQLRQRNPHKPFIILISSLNDLKKFNLSLSKVVLSFLSKIWPEKISVALPCKDKKMSYLHRGTKSLAFRFPPKKSLLSLLKKVGPLVAPSANPEGQKPAATIKEAQKYFSDKVDFYVDGGKINSLPSTLIKIEKDNKISVLREGEITINFID
ncbi:MAG: threonylcarbamoyl-AMP synthase [Candidatus Parcubacteria bacterium]|nr:L-threonylcarbamoyladenylate synthase [Patescibacteria group bacterium]BCX16186.1 MAG: threonylcarbamoyl-AMP synthase [Candidatus Parcubacteria bacterium]